jgi:hypothetical protein
VSAQGQLDQIERDKVSAAAEIRIVLEKYAALHGIPNREVNDVIVGYVSVMLEDFFFEVVRDLSRQLERRDSA